MFPKPHRFSLRQRPDFFATAKRVHSPLFSLFWEKRVGAAQAVVIVPKKVSRTAVGRNTLKRWLRADLSPTLSSLKDVAFALKLNRTLTREQVTQVVSEVQAKLQK